VVFAVLAMAVFGWGLHYKLSLYHLAGSNFVQGPVAKLLSQKEQAHPVKPAADEAADMAQLSIPALPWLALLGWMVLLAGTLGSSVGMTRGHRRLLFRSSRLLYRLQHWRTAHSLRPPPFFLLTR
jgi:hypothetical protein